MRTVALVALAACSSAAPPLASSAPASEPPAIRVAIAGRREVAIANVSKAGVVVQRTVKVPSTIDTMYWVGEDPVIMLVANAYDEDGLDDAKLDGTIGRITANGFEAYTRLAPETWKSLETPATNGYFAVARWKLVVTPTNEVWQGHCARAYEADDQPCQAWAWARVDVPGLARAQAPEAHATTVPSVAASPRVALRFVEVARHELDAVHRIRCEDGNTTLEFPTDDELDGGIDKQHGITWISTDPPIFHAIHLRHGYVGFEEEVIFEGCGVSETYKNATLVGGPRDFLALHTASKLTIRWRGRELATLPGAHLVRFAPK